MRKHDGTYCMCIDFRKLNQSTKKDTIPLPRTDDLLEALGAAQWFSSLYIWLRGTGRCKSKKKIGLKQRSQLIVDSFSGQ